GFALRVSYKGSRTFVLLYKSPVDDKRKRIKLGEYPYLRLAEAREMAEQALYRVKVKKEDPAIEARAERKGPTYKTLADLFFDSREFALMANSTQREIRRITDKDLIPKWGDRRLLAIERVEIARWGAEMAATRGGCIANRTHEYMRLIWHWGLSQPDLEIETT